jgi:hypothetical protein
VERKVPVTVFVTGIHLNTGRRFLRIHGLGVHREVDSLVERVFSILDQAIREEPAAWHFWSEAERIFEKPVASARETQNAANQT